MARTPKTAAPAAPVEAPAVWRHIDALTPWADNPRTNDPATPALVRSILRFGFPTVCTEDADTGMLTVGHTRTKALRVILKGGMKVVLDDGTLMKPNKLFTLPGAPGPGFVPVRRHRFASPAEAKAYALADNRLGELSEWDDDKLKSVVADILSSPELVPDMTPLMHDAGFSDDDPVMQSVIAEMNRDDAAATGAAPHTPTTVQGAAPDQSGALHAAFNVIVECADEAAQGDVLKLCIERGWKCRALL